MPLTWSTWTGPEIDKLVADNSYYRTATIPGGMYNNDEDIQTFGRGRHLRDQRQSPGRGGLCRGQGRIR